MSFHLHMLSLHNQCSLQFTETKTMCFCFLPFDLATTLGIHKSYIETIAKHSKCLGIGICNLFCLHDCLKNPLYPKMVFKIP